MLREGAKTVAPYVVHHGHAGFCSDPGEHVRFAQSGPAINAHHCGPSTSQIRGRRKEHVLVVWPHGRTGIPRGLSLSVSAWLALPHGWRSGWSSTEARTRTTVLGHPLREARVSSSARGGFGQFGGYPNAGTRKYLRHSPRESPEIALPSFLPSEEADSLLSFIQRFENRANFSASYSVTKGPARNA